ncbi:DUF7940 domain-containing protein [Paraburkholderia bannensis]|uniref:DUF7940 domain-containing protein n=1 Tax=Paraburkholderia bannensis TaxID=765414 RepID=UPI0005AA59C2|nr:hypothetical protein [Paraburkholderia bannensis]
MIWKITLADDWQRLHRRGTVIVSGAFGLVSAFGPVLRDAWRSMPDDLKTVIPAHVQQAIAYAILFATIIGVRYTTVRRGAPPADGQGDHDGTQ